MGEGERVKANEEENGGRTHYVPFAVGEAIADDPVPVPVPVMAADPNADVATADVAKRARKRKGRMVRVMEDAERAIV